MTLTCGSRVVERQDVKLVVDACGDVICGKYDKFTSAGFKFASSHSSGPCSAVCWWSS